MAGPIFTLTDQDRKILMEAVRLLHRTNQNPQRRPHVEDQGLYSPEMYLAMTPVGGIRGFGTWDPGPGTDPGTGASGTSGDDKPGVAECEVWRKLEEVVYPLGFSVVVNNASTTDVAGSTLVGILRDKFGDWWAAPMGGGGGGGGTGILEIQDENGDNIATYVGDAALIQSATLGLYGIVSTGAQTFGGQKTFWNVAHFTDAASFDATGALVQGSTLSGYPNGDLGFPPSGLLIGDGVNFWFVDIANGTSFQAYLGSPPTLNPAMSAVDYKNTFGGGVAKQYRGMWAEVRGFRFAGGLCVDVSAYTTPQEAGGTGSNLSATGPGILIQATMGAVASVVSVLGLSMGGSGANLSATGPGLVVQASGGAAFSILSSLNLALGGTEADLSATGPGIVFQASTGAAFSIVSLLSLEYGGTESDLSATGPGIVVQATTGASLSVQSQLANDLGGTGSDLSGTGPGVVVQSTLGAPLTVTNQAIAALTNNVTSGGTTDQVDDFTDLLIYANDAATIRNDIFQLSEKLRLVVDALRTMGVFT